jgi:elongation factor G
MASGQPIRNIGISAHIDAGKTTLSERILFYTGKIHKMHEVRDHEGGPTMDYMELEREKGITITSAAVTCFWREAQINLIDTPGHVDFTIEVERSLRVLDGAILVLDGVAGVQSQTLTVHRQMQRYRVPRLTFINKLDRQGARPLEVVAALQEKLGITPVLLQYPIGQADQFEGVIDLIEMQAHYFGGDTGEEWVQQPIPAALVEAAQAARAKLLDQVSLLSEEMMVELLDEQTVPAALIWETLRQGTLNLTFTPVLLGSALKNKGVQPLLDAVNRYLPAPTDRPAITATDIETGAPVTIPPVADAPLVALAFKLLEDEYGQLTYARIYAGAIKAGDRLYNSRTQKQLRVNRLIRIEVDRRQELETAAAGEIVGLIGVDCASGDTLCAADRKVSLEGMVVPEPVITLAMTPDSHDDAERLEKALHRFVREDPTLQVHTDPESGKILLSGMGELHLDIYLERIRREYRASVRVGAPAVAYRETITQPASFDYTLEHRAGEHHAGSPGQFAQVQGRLEPWEGSFCFDNQLPAATLPPALVEACEQGCRDAIKTGLLKGYPIMGVKLTLTGAVQHPLESTPMTFRFAARRGFEQAFEAAGPILLEPMMALEIETPSEFVGSIQSKLLSRRALLLGSETRESVVALQAEVPLAEMFGYSTELRSLSHGLATFSMEFAEYCPLPPSLFSTIP